MFQVKLLSLDREQKQHTAKTLITNNPPIMWNHGREFTNTLRFTTDGFQGWCVFTQQRKTGAFNPYLKSNETLPTKNVCVCTMYIKRYFQIIRGFCWSNTDCFGVG